MPTSPTSQSALLSGAAKDDVVGLNGDYTFTIADLLANDPGGAAKVDLTKQFFFGDTAADQANQAQYLIDHGIVDNHDGTYTISAGASDFSYFVQIGNKGAWSQADVDVAPHAGAVLFSENFEGYTGTAIVDPATNLPVALTTNLSANNWVNTGDHSELGLAGYGGIEAPGAGHWLDTQNSPGGINISHLFNDPTGGQVQVSLDIATQNLTFNGQNYHTDPGASLDLVVNGAVVHTFHAADFAQPDVMQHFDFLADTVAGGSNTIALVDHANPGYTGFAVDNIVIHDWIV